LAVLWLITVLSFFWAASTAWFLITDFQNLKVPEVLTVFFLFAVTPFVLWSWYRGGFVRRLGSSKVVMLCGLLVFLLAGLFPPWRLPGADAGYSFILSPPSPSCHLDAVRLLVEWACILAAGGVAWVVTNPRGRGNTEILLF
jgi:hypothetical protein